MIFFTFFCGGLALLVPTIQNSPPVVFMKVGLVCSSFSVTVLTMDTSTDSVSSVVMTVVVKLVNQAGAVVSTKSCGLVDNSGCTLTGFSVLVAGRYYMTVSDVSNNVLSQISPFDVVSDLQVLLLSTPTLSPSANFNFVVTAKLQDLCSDLITTETTVSLSPSRGVIGPLSVTTTSGVASFTLRSETSGSLDLSFTAGSLSSLLSLSVLQNLLKITNILPTVIFNQPSIENSVFTVTCKVFSNSGSAVASSFGTFSLTLSVVPSTPDVSGTLLKDTINGVAVFSDILINTSGTFRFEVTATDMIGGSSNDFSLTAAVLKTLTTDVSSLSVSLNQDFSINVSAFDQVSRIWWKTCVIDASSDVTLGGSSSLTTSLGFVLFTLRFTSSGSKTLTFTSGSASASVTVNVLKNVVKIKSLSSTVRVKQPMFIESSFDVLVQVWRNDLTQVEASYGSYDLNLDSNPSGALAGVLSMTTVSGEVSFTGIQFSKTGSFSLVVSGTDLISATSSSFTIIEIVLSSIILDYPKVLTVGFDFTLNVTIKDQFGNFWTRSTLIVLAINLEVSGSTQMTTTSGKSSFSLKFLKSGSAQVITTGGLQTKSLFLVINPKTIELNYEGQGMKDYRYYILNAFWIKATIKDFTGLTTSPDSGVSLTLSVLNLGQVHKSYSGQTSSGLVTFPSILIEHPGVYQILASSTECLNSTSLLPKINFGPASRLLVVQPVEKVKTKYFSSFSLKIFNSTEGLLPYSSEFLILDSSSKVLCSSSAASGTATFDLLFNETGEFLLEARAESVNSLFKVEVSPGNNSDVLCAVAVEALSCGQCRDQASQIRNGSCSCVFLSVFNETKQQCQCLNSLQPSNGFCVACGRYLQKSDLYAFYSEDYRKIVVVFQKTIVWADLDSCFKVLAQNSEYFKYRPTCTWVRPEQLEVSFERYPELRLQSIELNNTNIQSDDEKCSYVVERLEVQINQLFPLPTVQVSINGPTLVSLQCSEALVLKSSVVSTEVSLNWAVLSKSSNNLKGFIENCTQPVLVIPKNILSEGELYLSLTLTVDALSISANAVKSVRIQQAASLMLDLNIGSFVTVVRQNPLTVEVVSLGSCFEKFPLFTWKSEKIAGFDLLVNSSRTNHRLVIPPNVLQAGSVYSIEATSEKFSLSGTIQVKPSELVLTLSRSSGVIPLNQALVISVDVLDPDNPSSQFLYLWTCSQDFQPCLTRFGQEIEFVKEKNWIKVMNSSLIDGKTYRFQVQVKTNNKAASRSVDLTVNSNLTGAVEIPSISQTISNQHLIKILPKVSFDPKSKFFWTVEGGKFEIRETHLNEPFFCASGKQFEQGKQFKFSLSVQAAGLVVSSLEARSKLGPDCQDFEVHEFQEFLHLIGMQCWDLDDQDYPLMYQFGVAGKERFYFGRLSFLNDYHTAGIPNQRETLMTVCDSSSTCKEFRKHLKSRRSLAAVNVARYLQYLKDGQHVLESILALEGLDLNQKEFEVMFSAFFKYFNEDYQENLEIFTETLKIVENFKNFKIEHFDKIFPILEKNLKKINFLSENFESTLEMLYNLRYYLKESRFFSSVSLLLTQVSSGYLPVHTFSYDSKFIALNTRTFASSLPGFSTSMKNFKISFPNQLEINDSDVVDIQVIFCDFDEVFYFSVMVNTSGSYSSFNFQELNSTESEFELNSAIVLKTKNLFFFNSSACGDSKKLLTESCKFSSSSEGFLKVHLYQTGFFSLYEKEEVCIHDEFGVIFSVVVLAIGVLMSVVVIVRTGTLFKGCKNSKKCFDLKTTENRYPILALIPVTSAFQSQGLINRLTSIFQLSSSILVLLTGLKLTNIYLFKSSSDEKFSSKDLLSGFLTFLMSQPLTIMSLVIQTKTQNIKIKGISLAISLILSSLSLGCLLFLYFSFCEPKSYNWLLNFVIFGLTELFLMHPIYAFICLKTSSTTVHPVHPIRPIHTPKFTLPDEAVSGRSDNLGINSIEIQEEGKNNSLQTARANIQSTLTANELESFFESPLRNPRNSVKFHKNS